MQVFVVKAKERVFVFDNHAAALECRQNLKLTQAHLWGCTISQGWEAGEPVRSDDEQRDS